MEIKYAYDCGKDVAYEKVDGLLDSLVEQHSNKISGHSKKWNSSKDYMEFNFTAITKMGDYGIKGDVTLKDDGLILTGKLPVPEFTIRKTIKKMKETITSTLDDLF